MEIYFGNAPVSWGIYEFEGVTPPFGWEQVLDEMVQLGFRGVELGPYGFLPTDAGQLREELERRGLELLSAFVPVPLAEEGRHAEGMAEALKVGRLLQALGARYLVLSDDNTADPLRTARAGRIRPQDGLDPQRWKALCRGVSTIAHACAEECGLLTILHHHCAGYLETPAEVEAVLQETASEEVGLCLDTGHYVYGGGDPVEALRSFGERIPYLHFKDCDAGAMERARREELDYFDAVRAGVFCELGQGCIDYPAFFALLQERDYRGWGVIEVEADLEPDPQDPPLEKSRRSLAFLQGVLAEVSQASGR